MSTEPHPPSPPPAPATGAPAPKGDRRAPVDREFLPAALEILDTPPSPVRLAMLVSICALAAIALVWSWIGRVDVVAIATGKIQPTGRVKVVQPVEPGRILSVSAADGRPVRQGEVLVQLDPREAQADVATISTSLTAFNAEAQRRRAALDAVQNKRPPAEPDWSPDIPATVREREARVLFGEVSRLNSDIATLDAQLAQAKAEEARLETTIAAQQRLLSTQDVRIGMRTELMERAVGSKAQLLDAQEVRQTQEVNLRVQEGQLQEVRASMQVLERKRVSLLDGFVADNVQRLADVERRIDDAGERLAKARAALDHMSITAPISGTVTALAVIGPGQVVSMGEEIMRIVPEGSRLELEVYMPNRDIGFVHEGAAVVVKIDSFPFTRYGMLSGKVVRVAHDAVAEPDVQQSLASPANTPRTSGLGGTQRMQNLVFPVTIALDQQVIAVDGNDIPLSPGMTAAAEIKTGQRRILEYLFSPLVDVGSRALRER
ncbi:HlyD family type I secretion periplasmic adaptor subunit [Xanthobacter sp. V4C-4]|uniref:HlyD family type I secretion periplasmic adaptor subunit n=1 Tax=Xanthobacter cornucopiae TaxID=3119924 RepID=UPI0037295927